MIPDRLLFQAAVLTERTQTGPDDEYGTPTWETTEFVFAPSGPNGGVHIQPVSSAEIADRPDGRFTHRAWWKGKLPTSTAKLTVATGQTWEVVGPPREWTNPRTGDSYVEVDLVGFEGPEEEA